MSDAAVDVTRKMAIDGHPVAHEFPFFALFFVEKLLQFLRGRMVWGDDGKRGEVLGGL